MADDTVDDNLLMLRNTVGDLCRGFSRSVDPARWVADTQAFIDTIRGQIAAVRAENAPEAGQCVVCRMVYPSGGQHAGTPWAMSISGRGVCKRCYSAARDARLAAVRAENMICSCGTTMICPDIGCDHHKHS